MATQVQRIIEQAKRLPVRERRRVVSAIAASFSKVSEVTALRSSRRRSYASLLALAGTAHAEFQDISEDKYTHLAAAYADDEA